MKKRMVATLLTVLLLVGLGLFALPAAATPYFLVANDNLPESTVYNTPVYINGITYIPCTVFDSQHAGVSLGISYQWDRGTDTITLSNGVAVLEYNTESGRVTDYPDRKEYNYQPAVIRNGLPYVPAADTCAFFGLRVSFLDPEGCRLLRIKSGNEVISDSDYATMARPILDTWIGRTQGGGNSNSGGGGTTIVTPPSEETPIPVEEQPGESGAVFVALRIDQGDTAEALLSSLGQRGMKGIFFFSHEELLAQIDTAIDIVNQGSAIGIIPVGETAQEQMESIHRGKEILAQLLQKRLTFVLGSDLDEEVSTELRQEGYILWSPQVVVSAQERSSTRIYQDTLEEIRSYSGRVRLLFADDVPTGTVSSVLRQLQQESYHIRPPRETSY